MPSLISPHLHPGRDGAHHRRGTTPSRRCQRFFAFRPVGSEMSPISVAELQQTTKEKFRVKFPATTLTGYNHRSIMISYGMRNLTYEDDALNALRGYLAALPWWSMWGIVCKGNGEHNPSESAGVRIERAFCHGLLWHNKHGPGHQFAEETPTATAVVVHGT